MSDGSPWRPLIDVRDLATIFLKFIEVDSKKVNGIIYNVGFNESNYQVKTILQTIQKHLPKCEVIYTGEHGADSRSYKVNFNKLHKLFPTLKQKWPMDKSIKDLIKQLKNKKFSKSDFEKNRYTRLSRLDELLKKNKINKKLHWKV
jgi:nucleoside-diphosphate-sugar epimerase